MKLPLLVEFKPTINAKGPTVYLFPGSWSVESNQKDSEFLVTFQDEPGEDSFKELKDKIILEGDKIYKVNLNKVGSESSITIYAHKL